MLNSNVVYVEMYFSPCRRVRFRDLMIIIMTVWTAKHDLTLPASLSCFLVPCPKICGRYCRLTINYNCSQMCIEDAVLFRLGF